MFACTHSPNTNETNVNSLSKEERQEIETRVYSQLVATYRYHKNGKQDREVIEWRLRNFAFSLGPQEFARVKNDVKRLDDQNGFLTLMDVAESWRENLINSSAEIVYQTANEIRRQINTIPFILRSGGSRWDSLYLYKFSLAEYLIELAGNKGHVRAKIEFNQIIEYDAARTHLEYEIKTTSEARARLQNKLAVINSLADQDYLPAQFDLFHRFKDGRRIDQNLAASFYWGKRALTNGASISKDIGEVFEQLTPPTEDFNKTVEKGKY